MSPSQACVRSRWRSGTPRPWSTWCTPTCTPSCSRAPPGSRWWRMHARSCLPSTATRTTTPAPHTRQQATATTERAAGAGSSGGRGTWQLAAGSWQLALAACTAAAATEAPGSWQPPAIGVGRAALVPAAAARAAPLRPHWALEQAWLMCRSSGFDNMIWGGVGVAKKNAAMPSAADKPAWPSQHAAVGRRQRASSLLRRPLLWAEPVFCR